MTFLRLWNSLGGGPQLVPSGGSTVRTEKTPAEDTPGRECPHDVVGLRPHKGAMWMSNDRVPLENIGLMEGMSRPEPCSERCRSYDRMRQTRQSVRL